jgi:hypothetical protein
LTFFIYATVGGDVIVNVRADFFDALDDRKKSANKVIDQSSEGRNT